MKHKMLQILSIAVKNQHNSGLTSQKINQEIFNPSPTAVNKRNVQQENEEEEEDEEDEDITTDDEEINSDEELDEDSQDSQFPEDIMDEEEMIDQMMMEDEEEDDDDFDSQDSGQDNLQRRQPFGENRNQRKQQTQSEQNQSIQQDQSRAISNENSKQLDRCTNHQAADMGGINYLSHGQNQHQSAVNYSQKYGQGAQNSQAITVPRPNRQTGSVNHANQQMQNSQKQQYGTGSSGTSGSMFRSITGQNQPQINNAQNSGYGFQQIGLGGRGLNSQSNNQYPAILSVFQYGQNQFEELKQSSNNTISEYQNFTQQTNQQSLNQSLNAGDQINSQQQFEIVRSLANVGTTGSGGGATQRRNRRGNRQQNQQPSSGINGGELRQTNNNTGGTPQQRRQNRQSKNRQGRQGTGSKQSLIAQSVQLPMHTPENQLQTIIDEFDRTETDDINTNGQFGFERPSINSQSEAIMPSGSALINYQLSGDDLQQMNSAAIQPQVNNEQRGRHMRPYNRGRKQKNNQQPLGFSQGQQVLFQSSGSQQAQSSVSQQNLGTSCQNSQMEPVSLSQERQEREQQLQQFSRIPVRNPQGTAGQGGLNSLGIQRSSDNDHAVQQVIQMGAPASTNQHQEYSRYSNNPQIQSSAIQGAQALQQIYGSRPVSATQSIPASSASHQRNTRVGASAPSAQNIPNLVDSNPFQQAHQFNQTAIRGPVTNQIQGRNVSANIGSSGSLEGMNNPGQGGSVISNGGAVHTIPFESGSTSFMGINNLPANSIDEQSSSGLPNTFIRSIGQPQNNQQKTRAGTGNFDNNQQRSGGINHSISQVSQGSSPPSNNLNQIQVNLGSSSDITYHNPHTGSSNQGGNRMQQNNYGFIGNSISQASVSQQQLRGLNIPNSSDTNGPGAVGAPPSNNLHPIRQTALNNAAAINPSYSQYSNTQQRQRNAQFLPASRQNLFNNIPSSSGHNESSGNQAQQSVAVHSSYLVSVPEYVDDIFREQETNNIEIAQASGAQHLFVDIDTDQSNQQAIGIFPNSLFGPSNEENTATNQGSGGSNSTIINNQSNNQASNRLSVSPQTQLPAAFRANQQQQYNSGVNQSSSYAFDEQSYQNMRRTPPRRNNDSKKTSGANTPREDGANTPTTHQTYQNMRVSGSQNGFGSAVVAGLNNHLTNQRYSYQPVDQSNRQQQPSLQGGGRAPDTSMSITDQNFGGEGQSQNFQMNTASLFDDFSPSGGGPVANQMDRGVDYQANER